MGKHKRVANELHSELSEYSSLLRALRTSDTLDLTSHLTQSQASSSFASSQVSGDHDEVSGDDENDLQHQACTPEPTTLANGNVDNTPSSPVSTSKGSEKKKQDTWTRWPLPVGDVLVPEWGLEDEIKFIALHILKSHYITGDELDDEDNADEDMEASAWASALTDVSSFHLSRLLALLAAHLPVGEKSMQNRINPIGWETVLDVLGAYGSDFVDEQALARVKGRLESIYGPSQSVAQHRIARCDNARKTLNEALDPHRMSFLHLAPQPSRTALPASMSESEAPFADNCSPTKIMSTSVDATDTPRDVHYETRANKKMKHSTNTTNENEDSRDTHHETRSMRKMKDTKSMGYVDYESGATKKKGKEKGKSTAG